MKSFRHPSTARIAMTFVVMLASVSLVVAGCGKESSLVGGACAEGYAECSLTCVDVRTSTSHCGACGRACAPGVACLAGTCGGAVDATTTSPESGADASTGEAGPDGQVSSDGSVSDGTVSDGTVEDGRATDAGEDAPWLDGAVDGASDAEADGSTSDAADAGADAADAGDAADPCTPPFDTPTRCGTCTTVCGAAAPLCAPGPDGTFVCVPLCDAPLVQCNGTCVNLETSPRHCGACGRLCPSSFCLDGLCQGSVGKGSVVFVGDDGNGVLPGTALARLLSNAVLIRRRNVVQVLSFERYALPSAVASVRDAVIDGTTQAGRTAVFTSVVADAEVPLRLASGTFHVLLVHDQTSAAPGSLAVLGASWAPALATFVAAGGVVVELDGANGTTGEMPLFSTAAGLLAVTSHTPLAPRTPLRVVAPLSVVGVGVITPFAAGEHSARFTTPETNAPTTAVIVEDSLTSEPTVVHKVVP